LPANERGKGASAEGVLHMSCQRKSAMQQRNSRRDIGLGLVVAGTAFVAMPSISRVAWSQSYPTRPVRWIVPGAPGNAIDIMARLMGQWLSERFGQPFIVENRPGAGGNIGTEAVVRAPADGHTLLLVGAFNYINATLYEKLGFNFLRDIAPVASLIRVPNVMEVTPSFPATTVPELIAHARANPGKINFASPGVGSSIHVSGELFKMMTGIDMVHVPYRGSAPALTDLISGQMQLMFDNLPSSIEYIKTAKLRSLAVTTAARSGELPNIPTVGDFVPGYEASAVPGVGVRRGTPAEIIERLNNEINAGLAHPKIRGQLASLGGEVLVGSAADFGRLSVDETEKWAKVIKFASIKAE
jgi:tripartite-type tricarboxylate transporter receptor subunit TctC